MGYGLADTENKRLAATRTVFNIGQITNAYTAVAIMQLKEEGKLRLDDFIVTYLSSIPQSWQSITVRELLSHSSGIPDYTQSKGFDYAKNYDPDEIIALVSERDLLFKPGSQMQSSATNSYLLGLIIEKASAMSYQDYVTKNQINRLGLHHTFFAGKTKDIANEINNGTKPFKHSTFLKDSSFINPVEPAVGYVMADNTLNPAPGMSWTASFAASGIIASAEDISLWDIGLAGDILVKDPEDRKFLYSAPVLNDTAVPGNAGWLFPGHPGLMEIKGNAPGYSSFLSRFTDPSELLCVTLLANKDNLPDLDILARKIAAAFDIKLATPEGAFWSETIQIPYSVDKTLERVAAIIQKNGGTVFAHINHSAEAKKVNQTLADTEVLIIGNPAKGTALMEQNPAFALDLPLRIMATKDSSGQVWLSFTDPESLAKAYHVDAGQLPVLKQIGSAIRRVCETAVSAKSQI